MQRRWTRKTLPVFLVETDKNDIHPFLAHAPYTLNGCSADPALRDFARRTMADDLARLEFTLEIFTIFIPEAM